MPAAKAGLEDWLTPLIEEMAESSFATRQSI
jgi:hypothetical protein